jgi:fructokinase
VGDDPFPGVCPFHRGDCFEGLASGPAIEKRWGMRGEELPPDHAAWKLEARYIAFALVNLVCALSPEKIILGGGVMAQAQLYGMVREGVLGLLNGYVRAEEIIAGIEQFIVPPALGQRAGALGAIALAEKWVA